MDLDLPLKITELEYQIIIEMRVLQILSDTVCHCLIEINHIGVVHSLSHSTWRILGLYNINISCK